MAKFDCAYSCEAKTRKKSVEAKKIKSFKKQLVIHIDYSSLHAQYTIIALGVVVLGETEKKQITP